jgi:hypothetical protein
MKALNNKERTDQIIKFCLYFFIAVAITVAAIFFDFAFPKKINEQQKKRLTDYAKFVKNEKLIIQKIDTLSYQILRFGTSGENSVAIEKSRIEDQILFSGLSNSDSTSIKIAKKLEVLFKGLLEDKVNNRKDDTRLKELNEKINDRDKEIETYKKDIESLKRCAKQNECGC